MIKRERERERCEKEKEKEANDAWRRGRAPRFSAMAPAILLHGVTSIKPCNLNVNISIRNDRAKRVRAC